MNGFNLLVLEIAAALVTSQVINNMQSTFKVKIATPIMLFLIATIPLIISNLGIRLTNKVDTDNGYLIGGYILTLFALAFTVKTH